MGSEIFFRFPREKPSLTRQRERERERERERDREREGWPERSFVTRPWWGGYLGEQIPSECQTATVMFLGSLSQGGTTCTNLR
jgi:hypothetical protein